MTGQVEESIDEPIHFMLHQCSGARLSLLTQTAEAVDDQQGLRCDGFDELDLLWGVPAVNISFGDGQCAYQLLLKQQGKQQDRLWERIYSDPRWRAQAISGEYYLLTCPEAGKRRFVENI